jgi:hypothetical protein
MSRLTKDCRYSPEDAGECLRHTKALEVGREGKGGAVLAVLCSPIAYVIREQGKSFATGSPWSDGICMSTSVITLNHVIDFHGTWYGPRINSYLERM